MISMLIAAALAAQSPSKGFPSLKVGESYSRARTSLLRRGWRPVETTADFGDGTLLKKFGNAGEMLRAGFVEIRDCSGTGRNYCTFVWKRAKRCIHVVTYGEYIPKVAVPKVYLSKSDKCSGAD